MPGEGEEQELTEGHWDALLPRVDASAQRTAPVS